MSVKINSLQLENVKRVKAVALEPKQNGLTVIGGNNKQGKTSVLDSIAWLLGGNKFQPSTPQREGSVIPPNLKAELSNGLIVERKGKNSTLKVTDPTGRTSGQNLLDDFVEEFALNLPKFMNKNNKEKGEVLLQIIGVEKQLTEFNQEEKKLEEERLLTGRIKDQKRKYVNEMPHFIEVPEELVSMKELIDQQQNILLKNAENKKARAEVESNKARLGILRDKKSQIGSQVLQLQQQISQLENQFNEMTNQIVDLEDNIEIGEKSLITLVDESTAELEESISNVEETNRKIRSNLDRAKADDEAKQYETEWNKLQVSIESVREKRKDLLKGAALPLPGLSLNASLELTYEGQAWDNMSGADQLKVATAIVRKLNPECGFVLLDKLEQMDLVTLEEFSKWLEAEGLQAIATRVSTGEECTLIIEDGYVLGEEKPDLAPEKPIEAQTFTPPSFTPPTFG